MILFFTKGNKSVASSRQRVWFLAEKLKEQYRHDYEVIHSIRYSFFSLSKKRLLLLFHLRSKIQDPKYKVLFVHKSLFPWDIVLLIFFAKLFLRKRLLYDLDDAQWIHSPAKSILLARFADAVLCGSHEILRWAKQYNNHALWVPTVVDYDVYATYRVAPGLRSVYTIGWVGAGMLHFRDGLFGIIKPALVELSRHGVPFRFVVIGAQHHQPLKDYFRDVPFEVIFVDALDWHGPASVPHAIHEYAFDIGVMPQNDTVFNRAKCSFKAIEYMACGVPPVVSRVGENTVLIQDGINGFLAASTEEWTEKIQKLLTDEKLREHIGREAQRTVEERYSYDVILPNIQSTLFRL